MSLVLAVKLYTVKFSSCISRILYEIKATYYQFVKYLLIKLIMITPFIKCDCLCENQPSSHHKLNFFSVQLVALYNS